MSNEAQAAYWNAGAGDTWAALQRLLDIQLEPLGQAAIAALAPKMGEAILDIGCGCGASALSLGAAVGAGGRVLGADISAPMLAVARQRASQVGQARVTFEQADAQDHAFGAGAWDGVFSRFGVMFFADPPAAFANLRRALKPGGRLTFVCWRTPAENPWMSETQAAGLRLLPPPPQPAAPDPHAPGPFAFADGARVQGILETAGFAQVVVRPHDVRIGVPTLDDAVTLALRVGPLGAMLREAPDRADTVVGAVRAALAAYEGPDGVLAPSATWVVTARNPG